MAKVFISHSSKDKPFASRLSDDLRTAGHEPWIDGEAIKVGECIPTEIEAGLKASEYIILILTPDAVNSGWVDREWKARLWDEAPSRSVVILPALLKDCEIPLLLKTKKYADFRSDYESGFAALKAALSPYETLPPSLAVSDSEAVGKAWDRIESRLHQRARDLGIGGEAFATATQLADVLLDRGVLQNPTYNTIGAIQGIRNMVLHDPSWRKIHGPATVKGWVEWADTLANVIDADVERWRAGSAESELAQAIQAKRVEVERKRGDEGRRRRATAIEFLKSLTPLDNDPAFESLWDQLTSMFSVGYYKTETCLFTGQAHDVWGRIRGRAVASNEVLDALQALRIHVVTTTGGTWFFENEQKFDAGGGMALIR